MTRSVCLATFVIVVPVLAVAEQYWIAYEGNDFPENEGWLRFTGGGGAQRAIEDGWFVLDSRESLHIYDYYRWDMNGSLDPDAGEAFLLRWRLRVDEVIGPYDLDVGVFSDEKWAVGFSLNEDTIFSAFEPGVSAPFLAGVPHQFELYSSDMRAYQLYIDGVLAIEGAFWLSLTPSRITWGDGVQGAASLSHWDYVRFGVVPEPETGWLVLTVAWVCWQRRPRGIAPGPERSV